MSKQSRGQSQRMVIRRRAAEERELQVLEYWVKGLNNVQIGKLMDLTPQAVGLIGRRGLERRRVESAETVEQARQLYVERLEAMVRSYWPWATGEAVDPETQLQIGRPDVRAGELLLKILDRGAAVSGALQAVPVESTTTNNVMIVEGQNSESLRSQILAQLAAAAGKQEVVQAELVNAGADYAALVAGEETDDRPGLPPGEDE